MRTTCHATRTPPYSHTMSPKEGGFKMLKRARLGSIGILVAATLLITACGGTATSPTTPPVTVTDTPVAAATTAPTEAMAASPTTGEMAASPTSGGAMTA